MWKKTIITGLTAVAAFAVAAVAIQVAWQVTTYSNYPPGPTTAFLLALAIMVPMLRKIWNQPALRIATYTAPVGAFACLWVAAAEGATEPFTDAQWRLLGWVLVAAAGYLYWQGQKQEADRNRQAQLNADQSARLSAQTQVDMARYRAAMAACGKVATREGYVPWLREDLKAQLSRPA